MTKENDKDVALVKAVYEQHWLHIRHAANVRLWFINIFALIFAGSLASVKDKLFHDSSVPLICFLTILCVFEIFLGLKINSLIEAHSRAEKKMLEEYGLSGMGAQLKENFVNKWISISGLFLIFFLMCLGFFIFVLLRIYFEPCLLISTLLTGLLLLVIGIYLYWYNLRRRRI